MPLPLETKEAAAEVENTAAKDLPEEERLRRSLLPELIAEEGAALNDASANDASAKDATTSMLLPKFLQSIAKFVANLP